MPELNLVWYTLKTKDLQFQSPKIYAMQGYVCNTGTIFSWGTNFYTKPCQMAFLGLFTLLASGLTGKSEIKPIFGRVE